VRQFAARGTFDGWSRSSSWSGTAAEWRQYTRGRLLSVKRTLTVGSTGREGKPGFQAEQGKDFLKSGEPEPWAANAAGEPSDLRLSGASRPFESYPGAVPPSCSVCVVGA